jgi:superfamily II DNA/RNA helicase
MALATFVRRLVTVSDSFSDLGLLPDLVDRVEKFGIRVPTEIQCKSLPPLLEGKSAIINAETGSGKTLCYMLPFVQQLCRLSPHARTRPLGLFVVPSQELSYQVLSCFVAGVSYL